MPLPQVDVTDFLSIEIDQFEGYVSPDDNENPKKASGDDKYQSVSSSRSSLSIDQAGDQQTVSTTGPHRTDQGLDETGHFAGAVNEIENDLNNLAAIIQQASQISAENKSKNEQENSDNDPRKRHMLDEDDDTSRQATQNYDLLDHEPEVRHTRRRHDESRVALILRLNLSFAFKSTSRTTLD